MNKTTHLQPDGCQYLCDPFPSEPVTHADMDHAPAGAPGSAEWIGDTLWCDDPDLLTTRLLEGLQAVIAATGPAGRDAFLAYCGRLRPGAPADLEVPHDLTEIRD